MNRNLKIRLFLILILCCSIFLIGLIGKFYLSSTNIDSKNKLDLNSTDYNNEDVGKYVYNYYKCKALHNKSP